MDEHEFRKRSDAALDKLKQRLLELGDAFGFEVEGSGERLELLFEDADGTRFVISPNSAARQIWISALTTSFKLGWSDEAGGWQLEKTGESLAQVVGRILTQQLHTTVVL
ncbi:MAG TPA: iron donor protein CyaY [Methylomirabilota bacterium]|jgi:CyaY protein|nr:iron donor protein CyaY [Methylomirabilota bacterium]